MYAACPAFKLTHPITHDCSESQRIAFEMQRAVIRCEKMQPAAIG
jgi:hypothetical protein